MKKIVWPGGAKCAFSFAFDLDGDTIWRNKVWDLQGGDTLIRSKSIGLYGPHRGAYRILDIMDKYGLKCTWFVPAEIVQRFPELLREIRDAGHEIGNHGLDHRGFYGNTADEQVDNFRRSQEIFQDIIGKKAVGSRPTGTLLHETECRLFKEEKLLYYSRGLAEERISFLKAGNEETKVVNLPCRQELDEYIQMVYDNYPNIPTGQDRIAPYEDVLSNFIREIEGGIRFNNAMSTAFHPQVIGSPGKARILENLCKYVKYNDDVWCGTCEEVAAYWKKEMEA